MANSNNLHLDKVCKYACIGKGLLTRIYHPGMSVKGVIQNIVDYVGDKNVAIGATAISFLLFIWALSLFTLLFTLVFTLCSTIAVFVAAKLIFYKPKEYNIELDNENTILSFVKDVHVSGESKIVIHSQPGYGKEKNTFLHLQLIDSISVLDCRNITSVTDKSYRDIAINFFHPVADNYSIDATSTEGSVNYEVIHQSADQCRVKFIDPIRKTIKLDFKPS